MARWNRPLASGVESSDLTLRDPADWPAIVTLPASPPKAAMFFFTHLSASTVSRIAKLPPPSSFMPGRERKAQQVEPVGRGHDDDALGGKFCGVELDLGVVAVAVAAAMVEHHHRKRAGGGFRRRPDVQIETVFAVLRILGRIPIEFVGVEGPGRIGVGELVAAVRPRRAVLYPGPRHHWLRRLPAVWRRSAARRTGSLCRGLFPQHRRQHPGSCRLRRKRLNPGLGRKRTASQFLSEPEQKSSQGVSSPISFPEGIAGVVARARVR